MQVTDLRMVVLSKIIRQLPPVTSVRKPRNSGWKLDALETLGSTYKLITDTSVPDNWVSISWYSLHFLLSEISTNNRFSQYHRDENKLRKDMKSFWLFLVLPQLRRRTHRALFRSDCAFSRSFLRESYSGSLTRQTCFLSLLRPQGLLGL